MGRALVLMPASLLWFCAAHWVNRWVGAEPYWLCSVLFCLVLSVLVTTGTVSVAEIERRQWA